MSQPERGERGAVYSGETMEQIPSGEETKERLEAWVVDYDRADAMVLRRHLARIGVASRSTDSAERFLAGLADVQPHLLFVDLMLPGTTTDDLLQQIQSSWGGPELPVIGTGSRPSSAVDPATLGLFAAYLAKPYSEEALLAALETALSADPDDDHADDTLGGDEDTWDDSLGLDSTSSFDTDSFPAATAEADAADGTTEAPRRRRRRRGDSASRRTRRHVSASAAGKLIRVEHIDFQASHNLKPVAMTIEGAAPRGLRVRTDHHLQLGDSVRGSLRFVEVRERAERALEVRLKLRVEAVHGESGDYACGLAVESARPTASWNHFATAMFRDSPDDE